MDLEAAPVRLTRAAAALRMPYQTVLRLVLTGALTGVQDSNGKWWVDAESLQRRLRQSDGDALTSHRGVSELVRRHLKRSETPD